MTKKLLSILVLVLTLLASTSLFAQLAQSSIELDTKMTELAQRVLATTENNLVSVGSFTDTGEGTNFGPGLEAKLRDALNSEAKRTVVAEQAPYIIKGDYSFTKIRNRPELEGRKVIKVSARVIEREFNEPVDEVPFSITIEENQNIAQILQISGEVNEFDDAGNTLTPQKQNEVIDNLLQNPKCHIHGPNRTRISSSPQSPYALEIWVNGRPLPAEMQNGQAYVDLRKGDVYQVVLYNSDAVKTGANITIDGLDAYHFSDPSFRDSSGKPRLTRFVVPSAEFDVHGNSKPGAASIPGWFVKIKAPGNFYEFRVTGYGQGEASKAGMAAEGKTGIIHVRFAREVMQMMMTRGLGSAGPNETERGDKMDVEGVQEAKNMTFAPYHDFVAIRYSR